jgi:phosphoglycolate phosphatase-like HAD superfamily hydrolase
MDMRSPGCERNRSVMIDPQTLKELEPAKEFFIGIDSDGCVFDTMEIKMKECFCPAFINHFELQAVSKYARETWEFVNLYSKSRGTNRFPAVPLTLDLIAARPEVIARKVKPPRLQSLRDWVARETRLGNPALEAEILRTQDRDLQRAYEWSVDVNIAIKKIVRNVPPFPFARESLARMMEVADTIVVSQTPTEALRREWEEHGIDGMVKAIAGQELGTKSEHIAFAAGGKYLKEKMLMIGDAPGDLKAARANGALFFPINPGFEETSWEELFKEGLDRFLTGNFSGEYQERLINDFNRLLPEKAPWQK